MDKTPEDQYREELKKRLTEKPDSDMPTYYSRTGFRKNPLHEEPIRGPVPERPRRRLGLALMLPILLICMMSGNLRGILFPLIIAVVLYFLIKRKR